MMVGENAKPERDGGQDQVLARAQKHVEASDQQRIEQQKSGDMRQRQSRRDFPGEWQHAQRHAEHEQQDQAPQEFGNRQQQDRGEIRDRLEHRAAQTEQQKAAAEARGSRRAPWRRGRAGLLPARSPPPAIRLRGEIGSSGRSRHAARRASQIRYCSGSGRSRPISRRLASISAMVAFGGSDIAAGSTGSSRSTQNNSAETMSRIGIAASRRRAISLMTVAIIWPRLEHDPERWNSGFRQRSLKLKRNRAADISSTARSAAAASHCHISCRPDFSCARPSRRFAATAWSRRFRRRSVPDRGIRQFSCHSRRH